MTHEHFNAVFNKTHLSSSPEKLASDTAKFDGRKEQELLECGLMLGSAVLEGGLQNGRAAGSLGTH